MRINGFDPSKISGISLSLNSASIAGISKTDFAKADQNNDGVISASEFLDGGMGIGSLYQAFAERAKGIDGAFQAEQNIGETKQVGNNKDINKPTTTPPPQQKQSIFGQTGSSLTHPSYANSPTLAKSLDIMA